jgi:hypothetical protein
MLLQESLELKQAVPQHRPDWAGKADTRAASFRDKEAVEDRLERPDRNCVQDGDQKEAGDGDNDSPSVRGGIPKQAEELLQRRLHTSKESAQLSAVSRQPFTDG